MQAAGTLAPLRPNSEGSYSEHLYIDGAEHVGTLSSLCTWAVTCIDWRGEATDHKVKPPAAR